MDQNGIGGLAMRAKSLALILALMLLTAAQAREAWVVQAAGMADLVDADGRSRLRTDQTMLGIRASCCGTVQPL